MSKTDGEYELVLGNRQLLSAFFIVVILFGVFFTMGYVVGRNSTPASATSVTPNSAANLRPEAASPAAQPPAAPPAAETKEPAPVQTQPVTPPEKKTEPREQPAREVAARRAPEHASRPAPSAVNATAPRSSGAQAVTPGPGRMFLQVAAAAQPQAGVVVDTLKQKGFPAVLAQGPNPALFRVLVGPFPDVSTLGKAKADLESAGFKSIVRK